MRNQSGVFTISLDFELYWGLRDIFSLEECGQRLEGARIAIPEILNCFNEFNVHATWAIVGFLFFENKRQLLTGIPERVPQYKNRTLNPYTVIDSVGKHEYDDPHHYALSLIKKISKTKGQEIASHTFSHYYCLEEGQVKEDFRSDLLAAQAAARSIGIDLKSLVFPRNQFNKEYLDVCAECGFAIYRGNPKSWMWRAANDENQSMAKRMLRLADAYINISGRHCYELSQESPYEPINIPASRFLRPYSKVLSFLEPLRMKRIKSDMTYAAKHNRLYHLWWHPHNFGMDSKENINFLREILSHYKTLQEKYEMRSLSMYEAGEEVKYSQCPTKEAHVPVS